MAADTILTVRDLKVTFDTPDGVVEAVKGIDLDVKAGETLAVVGESGSGKSQTMMGIMGLLSKNGRATGSASYRGKELIGLPPKELNTVRGAKITMIFQEPMTSLDPLYTIGRQIAEPIVYHRGGSFAQAKARALELLELVGIPEPARRINSYPHELSGGQRQRVMIAMALANEPDILIADEPTTALDVTIQAQILDLLKSLQQKFGMAVVLITHDLGIVRHFASRVAVMRRGEVVETGTTADIFERPQADYTKMLLEAEPSGRKASPPDDAPIILEGRNVCVDFRIGGGLFKSASGTFRAVDDITLRLRQGQTIGIVGESRLRKIDARPRPAEAFAGKRPYPLRKDRHYQSWPQRHAPSAQRVTAGFSRSLWLAFAAPDGGRNHHGRSLRPRTAALQGRSGSSGDRGIGGSWARSGGPQPLSARILRRPAPAHRHCPRHNLEAQGRHSRRTDLSS